MFWDILGSSELGYSELRSLELGILSYGHTELCTVVIFLSHGYFELQKFLALDILTHVYSYYGYSKLRQLEYLLISGYWLDCS
jgi:hypothetical protein